MTSFSCPLCGCAGEPRLGRRGCKRCEAARDRERRATPSFDAAWASIAAEPEPEPSDDWFVAAFINDIHGQHHDTVVMPQVLDWLRDLQPGVLVDLGDLMDCPSISRFAQNPMTAKTLRYERDLVRGLVSDLRAAIGPHAEYHLTPGNHEDRINRYLDGVAPALHDMPELTLPALLDAERHGLTVHGAEGFDLVESFRCYHGTLIGKSNGMSTAARAELQKWGQSGISGHTHFTDVAAKQIGRRVERWWSNGHLAGKPSYIIGPDGWHQAVSLGHFNRVTGQYTIEQVPIHNRELVWRGKSYR